MIKTNIFFKDSDGITVELVKAEYTKNGHIYLGLMIADVPEEWQDDFFIGDDYADVSVNLENLKENEIAIDHNLIDCCGAEFAADVICKISDGRPRRVINNGFVTFPVYELNQGILEA